MMQIKGLYFMSDNDLDCLKCALSTRDVLTVITFQMGKDSRNLTRRVLHPECWAQVPDLAKKGIYELAWDVPTLIDRKDLT
jgi:hypothetical protein